MVDQRYDRRINTFVYEGAFERGVGVPDLPVFMSEHFAQCAEDIIVISMLRGLALRQKRAISELRYLEIGANHPVASSATFLMSSRWDMKGVLIEANPDLISDLRAARPTDVIVHAAVTAEPLAEVILNIAHASELSSLDERFVDQWPGQGGGIARRVSVPALRINDIIERYFNHLAPDYLSIDIEGVDFAVIQDLDLQRYRPCVLQIEPSDHFHENNSGRIIDVLQRNSYTLIAKTDVNLIFADTKLLDYGDEGISVAEKDYASNAYYERRLLEQEVASLRALDEIKTANIAMEQRILELEAILREAQWAAQSAIAERNLLVDSIREKEMIASLHVQLQRSR